MIVLATGWSGQGVRVQGSWFSSRYWRSVTEKFVHDECGDPCGIIEIQYRQARFDRQCAVSSHGNDTTVFRIKQRMPEGRAHEFDLGDAFGLESLHENQVEVMVIQTLYEIVQRAFFMNISFHDQRPTPHRTDQHLLRPGLAQPVTVL